MSLHAWGSDAYGQLGVPAEGYVTDGSLQDLSSHRRVFQASGRNRHQLAVVQPMTVAAFDGTAICAIAAGDGHTLVVTEFDDCLAFGRGKEGQLGPADEASRQSSRTPRQVHGLGGSSIVQVACGASHSIAVTASGRVYIWGLVHKGLAKVEAPLQAFHNPNNSNGVASMVEASFSEWATSEIDDDYDGETVVPSEQSQSRQAEYKGLLSVRTCRVPEPQPCLVPSLLGHRIVQVSAGYGHTCAVSAEGRLFSCGDNDRAQLGLGHRINTDSFQCVRSLLKFRVVQVACGQQHTLARVLDHDLGPEGEEAGPNLYAWGNNQLGQLGLGRRGGTAKLEPARVETLQRVGGVADIAAGANHSVAVSAAGKVYCWGHAEYQQQGKRVLNGMDLQDKRHFYTPHMVMAMADKMIVKVACGSTFTLALSEDGDVYSWGWDGNGVLGRRFWDDPTDPSPMVIPALTGPDKRVTDIAAGYSHALALTAISGPPVLSHFKGMVGSPKFADVRLEMAYGTEENESVEGIFAHRAALLVRCPYLDGIIRAATADDCPMVDCGDGHLVPCVRLPGRLDSPAVLSSFVHYLYTDRLGPCPKKEVTELGLFARSMRVPRLEALCAQVLPYIQRKWFNGVNVSGVVQVPESSYQQQMGQLVDNPLHADVLLQFNAPSPDGTEPPEQWSLYGHKALLCSIEYFRGLLAGGFSEGRVTKEGPYGTMMQVVDVSGFAEDGTGSLSSTVLVFRTLLLFVYTGTKSLEGMEDPQLVMDLLICAEKIGLDRLVQACERQLRGHIMEYPTNAANIVDFAEQFNLHKLVAHCRDILADEKYKKDAPKPLPRPVTPRLKLRPPLPM